MGRHQVTLSTLESKVDSLEAKKARLEAVDASLCREVEELKQDRRDVVSKVISYAALELVHSDELGRLVGKLVSSAITYGRCRAYEQVAAMKEPFDLSKAKGYRTLYKKDHTQASNDFATATFLWLDEFVADSAAPIEALLLKNPPTLQKPAPSRTQMPEDLGLTPLFETSYSFIHMRCVKLLQDPLYTQISTYLEGLKTSWKYSPKKPVIYHRRHEMDFRSFMVQGIVGEFNFLPEGGLDENQGSLSAKSVNNETPMIDAEPISVVHHLNVTENIIDSYNTSPGEDELSPVGPSASPYPEAGEKSKAAGKRKLTVDAPREGFYKRAQNVLAQASKVVGDASTPLDVDSDPDIHGKPEPLYGVFLYSLTTLSKLFSFFLQYLRNISIEQLCDIHDRANMRQAVLDNMLNSRTRELISALHKARASCDAIREREIKKDKAYAELEKKYNKALQDLDKNPLVSDMRAEIETLQGQVSGLHNEYNRIVLEEKKWVNYEQTLSILRAKLEGLESERERLKSSETQLLQEIDSLRQDMAALVTKVVPDAAMKLVHSDEMSVLVARLVKASIIHGRCLAFEEVAELKEPFTLEKMPGYRPFSKEEYDRASDDIANASYPFLTELTADPYASVEQLLSKKPRSLRSSKAS
ncbi:hypothetical protein Tco_0026564 [Tanacetum coccineum]